MCLARSLSLSVSLSLSLSHRRLNTSSLLCDCQLKWLPVWVAEQTFLPSVNASCAHPQMLKGRSVFAVSQNELVCGERCHLTHTHTALCFYVCEDFNPQTAFEVVGTNQKALLKQLACSRF